MATSVVLLYTPPYFRGTITDTPSHMAYHVEPGQIISASSLDIELLLSLGFTAAPTAASLAVAVTDGSTTVPDVTTLDFTSGATVTNGGNGSANVAIASAPAGAVLSTGKISLTNAQLLNLFSSPVPIIAAPGVGLCLFVIAAIYETINTPPGFTSPDGGPNLYYGSGSGQVADNPTTAFSLGNTLVGSASSFQGGNAGTAEVENQALVLANPTSNMTGGNNGTGTLTVLYAVISL